MPFDQGPRTRSIASLLCLLVMLVDSSLLADEARQSAVDLLAAYSGEDATSYSQFFQHSELKRIVGVEVHAVGIERTTARYSGREPAWHEVNNILRLTTRDGFEGVSGVDSYYQEGFSDAHLVELERVASELPGLDTLDPVIVGEILGDRYPGLSDEVRASIDIALWDLAARKAGLPLYRLLGAKRESMEPYASLPFYETLPEYVDAVIEYAELGFTAFKFHVWGDVERDIRLVTLVQQTFEDTPYRFMIDSEGAYSFDEALELGRKMDEALFGVLEAPIGDDLLEPYAELREALEVQVIPAGYNYYSRDYFRQAIQAGSWDAGRYDVTVVGGITEALELLIIADAAGLPVDIQSWGHSLAQAVNLHLMLANERTPYFEMPMPKEAFEFGMKNGDMLVRGRVVPPDSPGLGIQVDWENLATADFHVYSGIVTPVEAQ